MQAIFFARFIDCVVRVGYYGVMVEHSKVKRIAEELRAVHEAKLQAEADELRLVCELAESYRLGLPDSPEHEPLYEAELQLGNDFTPPISEFFPLELAGLLGIPRAQASFLTGQALDLKYRHITLWNAALDGRVEPRRALAVAGRSGLLSLKLIELATWRWTKSQRGLSYRAAINAWDRIVAELDPELAARREQQQLEARYVHIGRYRDGALQLSGQLDILDGKYLDAAIDQLADILPHHDPTLAGMDKKPAAPKPSAPWPTPPTPWLSSNTRPNNPSPTQRRSRPSVGRSTTSTSPTSVICPRHPSTRLRNAATPRARGIGGSSNTAASATPAARSPSPSTNSAPSPPSSSTSTPPTSPHSSPTSRSPSNP